MQGILLELSAIDKADLVLMRRSYPAWKRGRYPQHVLAVPGIRDGRRSTGTFAPGTTTTLPRRTSPALP